MTTFTAMPKYEAYKDSGVEWIGEIPDDWGIKKLSHLFSNIGSGTTPATGNISFYNGNISWLQTGDLTDGVINSTSKTISERALKIHSTLKQYKAGSLVVAMYGATIGKVGLLNISTATNQACCVLEKTDSVDMRFAFYLFMGFKSNIVAMGYGGGQPNISQDLIRNLRFPFPNQQLQTAIANFLDEKTAKIDEAIAIKEKQIELLKERKQIIIQQAVTQGLDPTVPMKDSGVEWIGMIPAHWEIKKVKHLFRLAMEQSEKNNTHELLSVYSDIGVKPRRELEERGNRASTTDGYWFVKKGDIVVNKLLAWMGAIGLSEYDGVTSPAYDILRPFQKLNGHFYHYLFRSEVCSAELKKHSRGIMDMRLRLYFDKFGVVEVPYPPLHEQNQIIEQLEKLLHDVDNGITLINQQIEKLKEYKTTLINCAVTGKIKVV